MRPAFGPAEPGFSKAIIAPEPDIRLGFISFEYNSPNGRYFCGWRIYDDGILSVDVEIPFGCTAELHLPGRGGRNGSSEKRQIPFCLYACTVTSDYMTVILRLM